MAPPEAPSPAEFEREAEGLLESIARARKKLEDFPGVLDGELDRFRDRVDRLIRESEVDNWRQVRIFMRDVDAIATDLTKASKAKKLAPKHVFILDASLRKARKRDFYAARKTWRKLDKVADQAAEVRRLWGQYRERYRQVEARVRGLRTQVERLERIPKPPASTEDANAFVVQVEAFNEAARVAYLDFLSRSRADVAIPLLLEAAQGGGIGVPAPPQGSDPEPLLRLLANAEPQKQEFRGKSFYGLLELPGYSDAKLTHVFGDSRVVRTALDSAWAWLKAVRDDERRSLHLLWSEDASVLKKRLPGIVGFLERLGTTSDATERGRALAESLVSGKFETLQSAARLYAAHGKDAERKWSGELGKDIEAMRKEAAALAASLKKVPEPGRAEMG